jgi:hypothetical protein
MVRDKHHAPVALSAPLPRERPCMGGWMNPMVSLEGSGEEKVAYPHRGLNSEPPSQYRIAIPTAIPGPNILISPTFFYSLSTIYFHKHGR